MNNKCRTKFLSRRAKNRKIEEEVTGFELSQNTIQSHGNILRSFSSPEPHEINQINVITNKTSSKVCEPLESADVLLQNNNYNYNYKTDIELSNDDEDYNAILDDSSMICEKLRECALEYNISDNALNGILTVLRQHKCFIKLPKNARTIMLTKPVKVENMTEVEPNGSYYHFESLNGIKGSPPEYVASDSGTDESQTFLPASQVNLFPQLTSSESLITESINTPKKTQIPAITNNKLQNNVFSKAFSGTSQTAPKNDISRLHISPSIQIQTGNKNITQTPQPLQISNMNYLNNDVVLQKTAPSYDNGFQRIVLRSLSTIKYDIKSLSTDINLIRDRQDEILNNFQDRNYKNEEVQYLNTDLFPLSSEEELNDLENQLSRDNYLRNKLVSEIALVCYNEEIKSTIRKIMKKTISDKILATYSYVGFKKKKSFSQLIFCKVIFDSIRHMEKYKMLSDIEIEAPLKSWIVQSKFREEKKKLSTNVAN